MTIPGEGDGRSPESFPSSPLPWRIQLPYFVLSAERGLLILLQLQGIKGTELQGGSLPVRGENELHWVWQNLAAVPHRPL